MYLDCDHVIIFISELRARSHCKKAICANSLIFLYFYFRKLLGKAE